MKRILAKILILVMLIGVLPMNVLATEENGKSTSRASGIMYSGTDGELEWSIDKNWHLTVTGSGYPSGYNNWDEAEWCQYKDNIVSAEIAIEDVEYLGCFFVGFSSLKTVDLSKFDMTYIESAYGFFTSCDALEKIYVPLNLCKYEKEWNNELDIELPYQSGKIWTTEEGVRYVNMPEKATKSFALTLYNTNEAPAAKILYSGTEGNLSWTIDSYGHFVLNGSGDPEKKEWENYADQIYSAEINTKI